MNVCPICHLGRLRLTWTSFPAWFGRHLMLVPRTPVLVCDVCGDMEYDPQFMVSLRYIVQQHTVGESERRAPRSRDRSSSPSGTPEVLPR
jgi:YgiT-type zinc finger domain-containing protein